MDRVKLTTLSYPKQFLPGSFPPAAPASASLPPSPFGPSVRGSIRATAERAASTAPGGVVKCIFGREARRIRPWARQAIRYSAIYAASMWLHWAQSELPALSMHAVLNGSMFLCDVGGGREAQVLARLEPHPTAQGYKLSSAYQLVGKRAQTRDGEAFCTTFPTCSASLQYSFDRGRSTGAHITPPHHHSAS